MSTASKREEDVNQEDLARLSDHEIKELDRRFRRKRELRLMVPLFCAYFMCILTRATLATAQTAGLGEEIHTTSVESSASLGSFYAGTALATIPQQLILTKSRKPAIILPTWVLLFGLITLCMGLVQNFATLFACRFLLGIVESSFYTGSSWHLSCWYGLDELALRDGLLFSAQPLAQAVASFLIASLLAGMNHTAGVSSWRWLLYITGGCSMILAMTLFFWLLQLPDNSRALSEQEHRLIRQKYVPDPNGPCSTLHDWKSGLTRALRSSKTWIFVVLSSLFAAWATVNIPFPTLVVSLGFTQVKTNLVTAPCYFVVLIASSINGCWARRSDRRFYHIIVPVLVSLICFILAAATSNVSAKYAALLLMQVGVSGYPTVVTWISNSFVSESTRGAALAIVSAVHTIFHVPMNFMYQKKYAPREVLPLSIDAAFAMATVAVASFVLHIFSRANQRLDSGAAVYVDDAVHDIDRYGEVVDAESRSFRYKL